MTSRRQFLSASAAMSLFTAGRTQAAKSKIVSGVYPFAEFEARIAKRDFRDMTKDILPTPCMLVDLDMFKANVKHMADTAKTNGVNNIQRAVALSTKDPTFMFVVDDAPVVDWLEEAAAARNAKLRIAVSVFAGMARQGIDGGQPALELAQKVSSSKRMRFEGFMAY